MPTLSSRRRRLLAGCTLLLLAGIALLCRVGGAAAIVLPGEDTTRLLGTDAYEHLRKAGVLLGSLSPLQTPIAAHGGEKITAGLHDWVVALPARLLYGPRPLLERVARVGAWLPPLLGAASVLALWGLAQGAGGGRLAGWAVTLYLLYPGEALARSVLGYGDHHAAEILLAIAAPLGLARWLRTGGAESGTEWGRAHHPFAVLLPVLPTVLLLLLSRLGPGAVLAHGLGLIAVACVAVLRERPLRPLGVDAACFGGAVAASLLAVHLVAPGLGPDRWTMIRAAWSAAILAVPLPALLLLLAGLQRRGLGARTLAALAVALPALGAIAAARLPAVQESLQLLRPRTPAVAEHLPVTLGSALSTIGPLVVLAPLGLAVALRALGRGRLPPEALVTWAPAIVWGGLWLATGDAGFVPPPFLSLLAAPVLCLVHGWLAGATMPPTARLLAIPLLAVTLGAPLWPWRAVRPPWATRGLAEELLVYDQPVIDAVRWLRDVSPAPGPPGGDYSVAAPWALGNLIGSLGERRALWGRFPTPAAAGWLLARTEGGSLRRLARAAPFDAPARYAVIDARSCGAWFLAEALTGGATLEARPVPGRTLGATGWPAHEPGAAYRRSLALRLCLGPRASRYRLVWQSPERRLTASRLDRIRDVGGRALAFRLVTVTDPPPELLASGIAAVDGDGVVFDPRPMAAAGVYEIVRGARIVGETTAGSRVVVTLGLDLGNGRRALYRRATRTDAKGRFRLTVSQPTTAERHRSAVTPLGRYSVLVDGDPLADLDVSPHQVRSGALLTLPRPDPGELPAEASRELGTDERSGRPVLHSSPA